MDKQHAKQFRKLQVQYLKPKAGFEAYVAVWNGGGDEVIIGAPTLEALADQWENITGRKLQRDRAQHVMLTYCDVPPALMEQARAALDAGAQVELRKTEQDGEQAP